ncbi:MAG: DUF72 domain-containing protein [Phycisphaerae bacterium]|jgi:uncharacterized protein YecE (DUF72 family)
MPARKPKHNPQPALFADFDVPAVALAPRARALASLGAQLPAHVRLGTSSWTFPSWEGLVYDRKYSQDDLTYEGLAAYAQHPLFRTVGLDRTFYRPMSVDDMAQLAARVPASFRFLVKAHGDVTRPPHPAEPSKFLDIAWTRDQIIAPAAQGLRDKLGVILFQFPPMDLHPASFAGGIDAFIDQLAAFLASIPPTVPCAVEVRNRELLSNQHRDRYVAALRQAGVDHCYTGHPSMPTVGTQLDLIPLTRSPLNTPVACRWLLHPTQRYEEAKDRYFPFHELKDEDPGTRSEISKLAAAAAALTRDILVIVNNKAEGSAPASIEQLAMQIVESLSPKP